MTYSNYINGDIMNKKIIIILFILILLLAFFIINSDNHNKNITNWKIDKNEYPLDEYTIDKLPVSHKSTIEVRQFFEDSDTNHDGILKGQEINEFDYKIKHSQYHFNGPYGYN